MSGSWQLVWRRGVRNLSHAVARAEATAEVAVAKALPFPEKAKAALEARHAAFAKRHPAFCYPTVPTSTTLPPPPNAPI